MPDGSTFQAPIRFSEAPTAQHDLKGGACAGLSDDQRAALAGQPDLSARFAELLAKAIADGPSTPGNRRNPFWISDLDGSELAAWKLFEHAEYTVGLDRTRAALAQKAAA